jgi:hypothetical protein
MKKTTDFLLETYVRPKSVYLSRHFVGKRIEQLRCSVRDPSTSLRLETPKGSPPLWDVRWETPKVSLTKGVSTLVARFLHWFPRIGFADSVGGLRAPKVLKVEVQRTSDPKGVSDRRPQPCATFGGTEETNTLRKNFYAEQNDQCPQTNIFQKCYAL